MQKIHIATGYDQEAADKAPIPQAQGSTNVPLKTATITESNGSVILGPLPSNGPVIANDTFQDLEDRAPIAWPEPIIPHGSGLPRSKSYISLATTIAGVGALNLNFTTASNPTLSPVDYPEIDYLQLVLQASTRIYDVAIETPLQYAKNLSNKVGRGNKIFLKREDMQPNVFSFKIRGAYNRISQLSRADKSRGVICMSAGNHAQGVALAAQKLHIKATIVMPTSAPEIKITAVRKLGATVVLYGADLEEAKKECLRLSEEHGYIFVPPYDDPYIIAGQGTVGMEIIRQVRRNERVDAIFIPVGGGGMLAGVAAFIKRVQPDIKIIGVNTVDSTGMTTSLEKRERTLMSSVGLFSDGTAVKAIGVETFRICSHLVDDMVLVTVDEICAAIKDVFDDTRSILEPAGALGVAGIKKYLAGRGKAIEGATMVAVTSGANMNFDRLRFVAERSRIGEGRECLLSCRVEEKPGSFMKLYGLVYPRSLTEVSYRYCNAAEAHVYLAFDALNGKSEMEEVVANINAQEKMLAVDITENDMAKSHLRFLAGGRAPSGSLLNERLYRFQFPERPGSFKVFLESFQKMSTAGQNWNLTLVHYRNTGGDTARILVGMDVPPTTKSSGQLLTFLDSVGYSWVDETDNTAYQHFLR